MAIFGKIFGGGERTSNHEAGQQAPQEDYPAFRRENNYENVKPKTEAERQTEISDAREAVRNAYKNPGTTNYETNRPKMDFETIEKKTVEFFDSLQGLCEGMKLFYGGRPGWPDNNSRNFMDKFGGDEFKIQKNPEMYVMMSFATMLIDAESERRKMDNKGAVSRDEKDKLFAKFQFPLYKVYVPQEMGGSAWQGFDKTKFNTSNPAAGFGGTYEKFFGSDEHPERKTLAEKAISLYSDLAPFMDRRSGMQTINKFLAENRGKKIEGFRKRAVVQEAEKAENFDLTELRDKRNGKILDLEDEIENLKKRGSDSYTTDRIEALQRQIQTLDDENEQIRKIIERSIGNTDKTTIKNRFFEERNKQKEIHDTLTNNRSRYEKGSEEYRQNEKNRQRAKRRMDAVVRILEKDF